MVVVFFSSAAATAVTPSFIFDAVAVEMDGGDGGVLCAYMKTAL